MLDNSNVTYILNENNIISANLTFRPSSRDDASLKRVLDSPN